MVRVCNCASQYFYFLLLCAPNFESINSASLCIRGSSMALRLSCVYILQRLLLACVSVSEVVPRDSSVYLHLITVSLCYISSFLRFFYAIALLSWCFICLFVWFFGSICVSGLDQRCNCVFIFVFFCVCVFYCVSMCFSFFSVFTYFT